MAHVGQPTEYCPQIVDHGAQQKERTSRFLERAGSGWLSIEEFAHKGATDLDA